MRFIPLAEKLTQIGIFNIMKQVFQGCQAQYPDISIKALTAVEIKHLAKNSNLSFQDILIKLKDAGLTSIPGGGAEILNDEIRDIICRGKETTSEYLEIHEAKNCQHSVKLYWHCLRTYKKL